MKFNSNSIRFVEGFWNWNYDCSHSRACKECKPSKRFVLEYLNSIKSEEEKVKIQIILKKYLDSRIKQAEKYQENLQKRKNSQENLQNLKNLQKPTKKIKK